MKRVFIKASDGFVDPKARVAARTLLKSFNEILNYLDRNEDLIENLLDDPSIYDAIEAEVRRLDAIVNG